MSDKTLKLYKELKEMMYEENIDKIKKANLEKISHHFRSIQNELTKEQQIMVNCIVNYIKQMKKNIIF